MSDAVAVALLTMIGSVAAAGLSAVAVIMASRAANKAQKTHELVNSKMTELIEAEKGKSRAEGMAQGETDERARERDIPR